MDSRVNRNVDLLVVWMMKVKQQSKSRPLGVPRKQPDQRVLDTLLPLLPLSVGLLVIRSDLVERRVAMVDVVVDLLLTVRCRPSRVM